MDVRMKASNHAFLLIALLPCPKFLCEKNIRGILEKRIIHRSLDIVCHPLKLAAKYGRMMSDAYGESRLCFTPLAAYIVDLPEATMLAGVASKTSPITMASLKEFGDAYRHEFRTGSVTLSQLDTVRSKANAWNLKEYMKEAKKFRLNGVHEPFWRDWPNANPCVFLTPEPLHHWHKAFFDHDLKWCIDVVGGAELDFRLSVLQPRIGFRQFKEGVSRLKQVTGRDQREIERYIVSCIADACPKEIVICIRALMDFRYLAQSPVIDTNVIQKISLALQEFHAHKESLLQAGVRQGKKKASLGDWYIPKLELLQSVTASIQWMGAPIQYTADVTEKGHSVFVKEPARLRTNLRDYDPQICRHLDRDEKCRIFDIATFVRSTVDVEAFAQDAPDDDPDSDNDGEDIGPAPNHSTLIHWPGRHRSFRDLFAEACDRIDCQRIFATSSTAFSLNYRPNISCIAVDEAARVFNIADLRPALSDYFTRISHGDTSIGGRRLAAPSSNLPFQNLQVWFNVRIQTKDIHKPRQPLPPQNVQAQPPSEKWPYGRCDTVIVCSDPSESWPPVSGLQGIYFVARIVNIVFIFLSRASVNADKDYSPPHLGRHFTDWRPQPHICTTL
jgi:Plavaka transposase